MYIINTLCVPLRRIIRDLSFLLFCTHVVAAVAATAIYVHTRCRTLLPEVYTHNGIIILWLFPFSLPFDLWFPPRALKRSRFEIYCTTAHRRYEHDPIRYCMCVRVARTPDGTHVLTFYQPTSYIYGYMYLHVLIYIYIRDECVLLIHSAAALRTTYLIVFPGRFRRIMCARRKRDFEKHSNSEYVLYVCYERRRKTERMRGKEGSWERNNGNRRKE